jgi:DNA-binding response OmpR family regulator
MKRMTPEDIMELAERVPQIMVVDDDPDTVSILARHLQREGFAAIEAISGAECLRFVHDHRVDVILLDLMMPEMDGFQVCRALKENPDTAEIPVIMITARDDLDARAEGMRLGVSDFLAKPVFRRQLANRIRAQLEVIAATRATEAALSNLEQANNDEEE